MHKVLPLFKSHYSLGKSILTLEKPTGKIKYPVSIFDLLLQHQLSTLVLVEDNMSGCLQASQQAKSNNIRLVFGLRLDVIDDMNQKDENSYLKKAKYIIFAKNAQAYELLVKIWSIAAQEGFYYTPTIDFKTLKKIWNKNLSLAIPFYDSFLHLNTLHSSVHIPELQDFQEVVFLTENNGLPFDDIITQKVSQYCEGKYQILPAQSIYYPSSDDFLAYLAFRCVHNKNMTRRATLEKPELDHMNSDEFNFNKWLTINENV